MRGAFRAYCSLNIDSARLLRRGHGDAAQRLAHLAERLEESDVFEEVLSCIRANVPADAQNTDQALVSALNQAGADPIASVIFTRADEAITQARAAIPNLAELLSDFGVAFFTVSSFHDDQAVLEKTDTGFRLPVARHALSSLNLDHEQAQVAVETEVSSGIAMMSFDPALALSDVADDDVAKPERLPRRTPYLPGQPMEVWPTVLLEQLIESGGKPEPTIVGPLPPIRLRQRA